MAVLPTPGSPIRTGLFFVRRCSTWMVRRISSSRPITGSSFPAAARAVRSTVYFSRAWRLSSALGSETFSPPRTSSMAFSSAPRAAPASFRILASPRSSKAASTNSSPAMYWSPRCWASLSVTLSSLLSSFETCTSPAAPSTFGRRSSWAPRSERSLLTSTPAFSSRGRIEPPWPSSRARSTCAGSRN